MGNLLGNLKRLWEIYWDIAKFQEMSMEFWVIPLVLWVHLHDDHVITWSEVISYPEVA